MDVKFKVYDCKVEFGRYANGNTAIQLVGAGETKWEGELVAVASVNGEIELPKDVVGIKTWSENEGMVQALVDGGIIEPEWLGFEPTGFVAIEHYRLTREAVNEIEQQKKAIPPAATDGTNW